MTAQDPSAAPLCLPPLPIVRRPSFRLPAGTCDSHMHVFGPLDRYRLTVPRSYTPHLVTVDDYRAVMAALGIDRAVLVQPSVYGRDNSALLDALATDSERFRGIVVVPPDIASEALDGMNRLGVRGIRVNRRNPGGLGVSDVAILGRRLERLGWHIQLQIDLRETAELHMIAAQCPVPIVIDHLGFIGSVEPAGHFCPDDFLRLFAEGQIWMKISAPYRVSRTGSPYADLQPWIKALAACRPDRLLWATDWPHTELWAGMPDDAALVESLPMRDLGVDVPHQILVANPAALYW
ncbi:MAG TPA: amidohydrolase family protein [Xanthobacteraceae bacterium]|nr:amidohydrolase family protein [Xanthobacteraceae bacterium]